MKVEIPGNGKTVGIMIGDVSFDYTMELMRGINDAAKRNGTRIFYMTGMQRHIAPVDLDNEQETISRYNSIYDYANMLGADAFIISFGSLSGIESEEEYQRFFKRFEDFPYVLLQKDIDAGTSGRCSVTIDNYCSFSQCIEHLVAHHGYQKIAYVSGPKHHPEAREREQAYRDTMKKFGLAVDNSLIMYGDLSGFVNEQVIKLLENHPDLDAIAFCNDEMAKTGYEVCESRGLRVGIDIAITGFDDFTTGQTMTPPLTTVSQDAYQTGECALVQALALATGEAAESIKLKTNLIIRNSCGCYHRDQVTVASLDTEDAKQRVNVVIENIRENLSDMYKQTGQDNLAPVIGRLVEYIKLLALTDTYEPLDSRALDAELGDLATELNASSASVAERLQSYLIPMIDDITHPRLKKLYQIILYIQGFMYSYAMRIIVKRIERFRTQIWFVPEFIRDLVVIVDEDERVFQKVVNKLRVMGLKNLYICLLPEPEIRRESHQSFNEDRLLLAAYLSDNSVHTYPRTRMPVIDSDHPLRNLRGLASTAQMISFSIFSGDVQFGICLCETDREFNSLMHIIGLQLGILMNFLDLKRKERIITKEIEHVQKKNEELNYLSEYDTLCNIYNRRGFIEQALRLNQENLGKRAFLAFADLDYLKKINDNFGHAAGDDAIRTVSNVFKSVIRSGDLIARISGDEFVGMFIADSTNFREHFESRIKQATEEYNRMSGNAYYVDVSIGITDFTCSRELEISQIIDQADQYLYQAKQHKRSSIMK
ncbi:MAG: GGDEF domain-containing protein [Clostridiales bacterium]|nr:GGDEF domain-containing protein [Clostridiales bacterium]